ncbi:MAG: hypothetical protein JXA98_02290 [Methanosarcinaceae archaeon]|nr:hypothetical protein [Methanosarcinaceae archaeon]
MAEILQVYDIIKSDTLRSRQAACNIVDTIFEIPPTEDVYIDFNNIIFASRSFCHELLTAIKQRKNVHLVNTNSEIKKMCDVATKKPEIIFDFSNEKKVLLEN